jgi:hypothetical protein
MEVNRCGPLSRRDETNSLESRRLHGRDVAAAFCVAGVGHRVDEDGKTDPTMIFFRTLFPLLDPAADRWSSRV